MQDSFFSSSFSLGNSTSQSHLDIGRGLSLLFNRIRKFGKFKREYFFCASDTVYSSVILGVYLYSLLPSSFLSLVSDPLSPVPVGHLLLDGGILPLG